MQKRLVLARRNLPDQIATVRILFQEGRRRPRQRLTCGPLGLPNPDWPQERQPEFGERELYFPRSRHHVAALHSVLDDALSALLGSAT